jgi:hypothetical protein
MSRPDIHLFGRSIPAYLAAGSLCLLFFGPARLSAQPPTGGAVIGEKLPEKPGATAKSKVIRGVVKSFTTDPKTADINGMILEDGTRVRWWPHLAKRFTALVSKGDPVEVVGRTETIDKVTALHALRITNLRNKAKGINDDTPPPPERGVPKTVRGTVKRFTTLTNGEVNGMVLSDGSVVVWPAGQGKRFTGILARGDRAEATGRLTKARGETVLEVTTVTNLSSKATREVDLPPAAPPAAAIPRLRTVRGVVRRLTVAPKGGVDGMELKDGTIVHWPPDEKRFTTIVAKGDRVEVTGTPTPTARGDEVLEARSILNIGTKKTIDLRPTELRTVVPPPARIIDLETRVKALEERVDRLVKEVERLRLALPPVRK